MKKVLIITYYWPPAGGAGVQRWLKITKYIRKFGWEPIIYTPENPEAPAMDHSLVKDVAPETTIIKKKIFEPYVIYNRILGGKKRDHSTYLGGKRRGIVQEILIWIRGNAFIPDPKIFWVSPSVKYLARYVHENKIDAIVSTGPPHSMHLIALKLKQRLNLPWIADFRDPWTFIDFFDQLNLTSRAKNKHLTLESKVVKRADKCVTVSPSWAMKYEEMYGKKFDLIYNGYDVEDFHGEYSEQDEKFSIVHIGSLNRDRNPEFFWDVLKEICSHNETFSKDLQLKFIGSTNPDVFEILDGLGLHDHYIHNLYVPHEKVSQIEKSSQVLLLLINNTTNKNGIIPGKLFEYLAAQRPILCIGDQNSDVAKIINECSAGRVIDFGDSESCKFLIENWYEKFKTGTLSISSNQRSILKYSRENAAYEYSKLLSALV